MRHAAGRIPPPPVQAAALIIQVNITVILHILKSIAFVSGNVLRSTRSSREDRHVLLWSFFFFFSIFGGPANLCDSVATECLPAAESEALQQPSSPQPTARSLDASLRTPTDSLLPPQPRAALSELAHLYSVYYYCCARVCPQQPPPSLSCKDHFIQRRRCLTFFFFFPLGGTYGFAIVH